VDEHYLDIIRNPGARDLLYPYERAVSEEAVFLLQYDKIRLKNESSVRKRTLLLHFRADLIRFNNCENGLHVSVMQCFTCFGTDYALKLATLKPK
jgi:hypothetical protein